MNATQAVDKQAFRQAMSTFGTGVVVATVADPTGGAGITVNSFTSVSLEPPLVLWCLGRESARFDAFVQSTSFGLSVLGAEQQDISRRFASEAAIASDDATVETGVNGAPLIRGALAWFECDMVAGHEYGDHMVIIGHVTRVESREEGGALAYFRSGYAQLR